MIRSKHYFPIREYAIAVTTSTRNGVRKTRYFYGRHLKDAIKAAGKLLKGRTFTYCRYERQSKTVAEITPAGHIRSY